MFDSKKIRNDFPIIANSGLVYLDNASTTHKPNQVIQKLVNFYSNYNANVHRGIYGIAEKATDEFESARDLVSNFIGSDKRDSIVFTSGTTESVNLVAYSLCLHTLKEGDEILLSEMEHHSNIVPWQIIGKRMGVEVKFLRPNADGVINNEVIINSISDKTRVISLTHQSNVTGVVNDIASIASAIKDYDIRLFVDAAQSVGKMDIDVLSMGCDYLAFSAHKLFGPTGFGVLYIKPDRIDELEPFMGGGEMIKTVTTSGTTWNSAPWKYEAGTPGIAQAIATPAAINYINDIGLDQISSYISKLTDYTISSLLSIDGIDLYTFPSTQSVISFNINGAHPFDLAKILDQKGVCIRAGHHCAQPLHKRMGIEKSNRVSLHIYNTYEDIDYLIDSIRIALDIIR